MVGSLLLLVAGWYRSALAAVIILVAVIILQCVFGLPQIDENRRLLGLPPQDPTIAVGRVILQAAITGAICFLVGLAARWVWDKRAKNSN